MKIFFKNETHTFTRKAYFCKEPFHLFGHGLVEEDKLIAFEEKHNLISIYEHSVDEEILQMLIDSGYIRVENVPTLMFINSEDYTNSKKDELDMGGWEEVHYLK